MGICKIITVIFVLCKIFGFITWAWWLVLLPEIIAVCGYFALLFLWILGVICTYKN